MHLQETGARATGSRDRGGGWRHRHRQAPAQPNAKIQAQEISGRPTTQTTSTLAHPMAKKEQEKEIGSIFFIKSKRRLTP